MLHFNLHILLTVIIDHPKNPKCSTGDFERVWQISKTPNYENSTLGLQIEPFKRNIEPQHSPAMDILKQYDENEEGKLSFQLDNEGPEIEPKRPDRVIITQPLNIDPAVIDNNPLLKANTLSKSENELLILKRSSSTAIPNPGKLEPEMPTPSIMSNASNQPNRQRDSIEAKKIAVSARQSYASAKTNNMEKKRSILKISTDENRSSKDSSKRVYFSNLTPTTSPQKLINAQNNYMVVKDPNKSNGSVASNAKSSKTSGNKFNTYMPGSSTVPPVKSKPKRSSSDSIPKVLRAPQNSQQSLTGMGIPQKTSTAKQFEYKQHINDLNKLIAIRVVPRVKPKRKLIKLPDNYFSMQNKNQAYTMPSVTHPATGSSANSIKRSPKVASQNLSSLLANNRNFILNKIATEATDRKQLFGKSNQATMNRRANEYIENLLKETKNISNNTIKKRSDNSRISNYESIFRGSNQIPFSVPIDKLRPNRKY